MFGAVLLDVIHTHKISTEGLSLDMDQRATKAKRISGRPEIFLAGLKYFWPSVQNTTEQSWRLLADSMRSMHTSYTKEGRSSMAQTWPLFNAKNMLTRPNHAAHQ